MWETLYCEVSDVLQFKTAQVGPAAAAQSYPWRWLPSTMSSFRFRTFLSCAERARLLRACCMHAARHLKKPMYGGSFSRKTRKHVIKGNNYRLMGLGSLENDLSYFLHLLCEIIQSHFQLCTAQEVVLENVQTLTRTQTPSLETEDEVWKHKAIAKGQ